MIRLRRAVWAVTACYWIALFVLTHLPAQQLPVVAVSDKLMHALAYALLAGLLMISLHLGQMHATRATAWTLPTTLLYGAADEWLQIFVGRSCELGDWLANAAGVLLAVGILLPLLKRRQSPAAA